MPFLLKPIAGQIYFKNKLFDYQMLRTMSRSRYGGPDFGECLAAATRIEDGNWNSWLKVWRELSDHVFDAAVSCERKGHRVSARTGYLRASECYRTASFPLLAEPGSKEDILFLDRIRESFRRAAALLDSADITPVEIPFENISLPGYFMHPKDRAPKGTLILNMGYNGVLEEGYYWGGAALLERGWNVLTFDGPGQGHVFHRLGLPFRPDWEKVITPVVNFALSCPGVERGKLALMGRSFGACLCAIAAVSEHRINALVLDPGELDMFDNFLLQFPPDIQEAFRHADNPELIDRYFAELFARDPGKEFAYQVRMLSHGCSLPRQYIEEQKKYTVKGREHAITAATFVTAASHDDRGIIQPHQIYHRLSCPKTFHRFSAKEGAGDHCEAGAPAVFAVAVCDWLDETFAAR